MHKEIENKSVLITGASRGIGAAATREFASNGAKVVLAARSTVDIEALAQAINNDGGTAIAVGCDVSNYQSVENAVETCVREFGGIDILVNNAGVIDPVARMADSDPAAWAQVIDINLKGVYYGLRSAIPHMEKQGFGVVVNISSGAATNALEGWSHYCASKAGVLSLTKCAHKEVGDRGIRVVGMSPGTVATDMQHVIKDSGINPVSQMNFEDHIPASWPAKAIVWLCTAAAADNAGTDFSIKTDEGRRLVGLIDQG